MESEEYFKRMYEQNGAYNITVTNLDYTRTYGETVQVINTARVGMNNESAGINIHHPIIHNHQEQHPNQHQQHQPHGQQQHQQPHEQQQHQQQPQITKSLWMNQRKYMNPLVNKPDIPTPQPFRNYENGPAISALPISTPMNMDYMHNNFLPVNPVNLNRSTTIPQKVCPEPIKKYHPELLKTYDPGPPVPEMYNLQPHIVLNSQYPKAHIKQEQTQSVLALKRKKSELLDNKGCIPRIQQGKQYGVKLKGFTDDQETETEESHAHVDSYIDSTYNSGTGEKVESHDNICHRARQVGQCHNKVKDYTENQEPETETDSIISALVAATTPVQNVVKWLQQHQMLNSEMKCDNCGNFMALKSCKPTRWLDGFFWECRNNKCGTRRCNKNIRAGSIFAGSTLRLKEWLHIMNNWCKNVGVTAASNQMLSERKFSRVTTCNYYSLFREVCGAYFKSNPIKIGGPENTIVIDVFCFTYKRKSTHGREAHPPSWFLIIIDTSCTPSFGYVESVETTDNDILLPIILKVVQPGSIIYCKEWRSYTMSQGHSDKDGTVNQSVKFMDINTSVNKQKIESCWNKLKNYLSARKGSKPSSLNSYLQEFMWRETFSHNTFESICDQIADQYCDSTNDSYLAKKPEKRENYSEIEFEENFLEEPPHKKRRPRVQHISHSVFQDSVTQDPSAGYVSYIEETDGSCSEEDINYLEMPPGVQQGRQCSIKVGEFVNDQEPVLESDNVILQLAATKTPILNVIRWLQQHQLLKSKMKCDHCESFMAWCKSNYKYVDKKYKKWLEGFFWECKNRQCPNRRCTKTIRAGSIFADSKLNLKDWLHIMYKWSKNVGSTAASNQVLSERKFSRASICSYYSLFREVCITYFRSNPIILGGPGIPIQIDVSCFAHKRKLNHGREALPPSWFLVIIDTSCTPSFGYVESVDTTDIASLLPIILKVVQPGSIIHSKEWKAYTMIQSFSGKDGTVNQSVKFVDINTSVDKQKIDSYWNKLKTFFSARKGSKPSFLNSYLQEFMWRERFSNNEFKILCEQIAIQYCNASFINNIHASGFVEEIYDASCIDEADGSYSGDEIEKHSNYLEVAPSKIHSPEIQEGSHSSNKIRDYTDDQELDPENDNVIMPLFASTTPIINLIRWLQKYQLLKREMNCDHCERLMSWNSCKSFHIRNDMKNKKYLDQFFWECKNVDCSTRRSTKTIRAGSLFAGSRLCLKDWLHMMYIWCKNIGSTKASNQVLSERKFSRVTTSSYYSLFREVCETYFKTNPIKLGGPGLTLVIDVFHFAQQQKLNHEDARQPPSWVLVIIDTSCTPPIGYIEIINTTDSATLLPIILKVVQPGSIVHSKEWRAYRKIQGLSDKDGTVKHSVDFVDVNTSVEKQSIESYWKKIKSATANAARKGSKPNSLNSHLQEFMWRERFSNNALEILCEQIAVQHSDSSFIDNTHDSKFVEKTVKQKKILEMKIEENINISEKPRHKKCTRVQQISHSIFQDGKIQDPSASDYSYIDKADGSFSGEEMEKHSKKIKFPPNKVLGPEIQKGRKPSNKVKDFTDDQHLDPEGDNAIMPLVASSTPTINVIRWFQKYQLLNREMKCDYCKNVMAWKTSDTLRIRCEKKSKKLLDGFFWECMNKRCLGITSTHRKCRKNIRDGSFFAGSNLYLKDLLHIMYIWCKNIGSSEASNQVGSEGKISRQTTNSYYSLFREVCETYFKENPIKLGGPGLTLVIDVFCFAQQQKLNHEDDAHSPSWILVIIDTSCTPPIGYIETINTTDTATLLPIILKVVQPGSIVHSKEWKAYQKIQGLSDKDGTTNHSVDFVDVNTSVDKQLIESYWKKVKSSTANAARKSSKPNSLNSHLQEFMWRERFSNNALEILCEQIASQYSLTSFIDKTRGSNFFEKNVKEKKYLELKLEENENILEEPRRKKCPRVQQVSHSIFQDGITQDPRAPDDSYIDKADGSFSGEEIEKHSKILKVPPSKILGPEIQKGRKPSNKVKDFTDDQQLDPEGDNIIMPLVASSSPTINVIRWFQKYQLLNREMKCDYCKKNMAWKTCDSLRKRCDKKSKKLLDGFFWECMNKRCLGISSTHRKCRKNIRDGSFFAGSNLYLKDLLHIMYIWCKNVRSSEASKQVGSKGKISRQTTNSYYSLFREVCETYFKANPIKLGGPGLTLVIDVFCFAQQQKLNHEDDAHSPSWVLVIIDTSCTPPIGYIETINTTDSTSLLPIILKVVQPGSIVHCKEWKAYNKIQGLSDMDGTTNHPVDFVDVNTSMDNQLIESYWKKLKSATANAARKSSKPCSLNSHLQEFMWRERFSNNALEILCEQIAVQYSVTSFIDNNGSKFVDTTDGLELAEEKDEFKNCLEMKLEGKENYLESLSLKMCLPTEQQGRQSVSNVKEYTEDEEPEPEVDTFIRSPVAATRPIVDVIKWFQERQLLDSKMKCDYCNISMSWKTNNLYNYKVNEFFWKCENENCSSPNCTKSISAGSFFAKSLISLPKWFDIMYLWSKNVGGRVTSNQVNISHSKILDCYRYFRDICNVYFKENPIKLGGPEIPIVVDVFCFSNKRKRNHESELLPLIWVLVMVDKNSSPSIGYMEIVETRDVDTLLPIILKVVQPGSIIHSKEWESYHAIQSISNTDRTVKQFISFVDFKIDVHGLITESYWNKHKSSISARRGTIRSCLNTYLTELLWHERFSENSLEILCEQIAVQYTDASCLEKETEKRESAYVSYIDNIDSDVSEEEIEKHTNYLEVILEENIDYLEEPPSKMCRPGVWQCINKIEDYNTENQENDPESKKSNAFEDSLIHDTDDCCMGESSYYKNRPRVQQERQCDIKVENYNNDDHEPECETDETNVLVQDS